jgi:hypothetical protein
VTADAAFMAGAVLARNQAEIGFELVGALKALRIIDHAHEHRSRHGSNTRDRAQMLNDRRLARPLAVGTPARARDGTRRGPSHSNLSEAGLNWTQLLRRWERLCARRAI